MSWRERVCVCCDLCSHHKNILRYSDHKNMCTNMHYDRDVSSHAMVFLPTTPRQPKLERKFSSPLQRGFLSAPLQRSPCLAAGSSRQRRRRRRPKPPGRGGSGEKGAPPRRGRSGWSTSRSWDRTCRGRRRRGLRAGRGARALCDSRLPPSPRLRSANRGALFEENASAPPLVRPHRNIGLEPSTSR